MTDSKSKSSAPAAMRSSTDSVPSGEPSRHTMCSMSAPLARIRSTYCASHITTLVSALSNRYTNCSAGRVL